MPDHNLHTDIQAEIVDEDEPESPWLWRKLETCCQFNPEPS